MQDKNNSGATIDDIVNIIAGSVGGSSADPVSVELVFGVEKEEEGEQNKPKDSASSHPLLSFEEHVEEARSPELSVPDAIVFDESVGEVEQGQTPVSHIPYVPRFTGATERIFASKGNNGVTVEKKLPKYEDESIDPTAEIYNEDDGASEVSLNVKQMTAADELGSESSSLVFKFPENELQSEECVESEEITAPTASEPQAIEEEKDEPIESDDTPREYTIPDPHEAKAAVISYAAPATLEAKAILRDAPVGVGDPDDGKQLSSEYSVYAQRDVCKDKFLDALISAKMRLFVAAFIALMLLSFETLYAFGIEIPLIPFATAHATAALFDTPFVVCLYLLALPEVIDSFRALIRGRAVPELFITATFAVTIAYNAVAFTFATARHPLFGFIFAIFAIGAIFASHYKKSAEFISFKVISENKEKRVIDTKLTRTLEAENAVLDGIVEEHKSKTARLFRTAFVSDFFKKTSRISENSRGVVTVLLCALGISLVTGAVAYFVPGGVLNAAVAFSLVFLLSCPAMSITLHKLPFYYSTKQNAANKGTAIGESSLIDYSSVDVITFDDTEVFGEEDVTLQRILLFGNSENLTKALRQMSALFMNVGGPLDHLFSSSLDRRVCPADNTYIETDGVGGEIDGVEVLAGTYEFMKRKGISFPSSEAPRAESIPDSTRIMYAAEGGAVYAKFYVRYSFSEDFSMLLPTLLDEGIKPLVYTRDPNVTGEVVKTLTAGVDRIRVLKKTDSPEGDDPLYRKVSAGLVTYGDKLDAINMLLHTKKYARLQSRLAATELIAMLVGASLAALLALSKMYIVPSFVFAVWQIAWCTVIHVISKKNFSTKKKSKK